MSLFNEDLPSSDSENDADYVPDAGEVLTSDDEEPLARFDENEKELKAGKQEKEACEEIKTSIDEKQKANDLYKTFLSEVEEEEKKAKSSTCNEITSSSSAVTPTQVASDSSSLHPCDTSLKTSVDVPEKKSCKLFDFAGETVAVSNDGTILSSNETPGDSKNNPVKPVVKKRGLEAVLSKIQNKKPKMSVLDKTSLDWKHFKKSEAIEDELAAFRKSKEGFIERQRFLERSDFRAFEVERDMRLKSKKT